MTYDKTRGLRVGGVSVQVEVVCGGGETGSGGVEGGIGKGGRRVKTERWREGYEREGEG